MLIDAHVHLDKYGDLLDDALKADQLRPLIPRGPSCVLATSRKRLTGLAVRDGAHLVRLGPLAEAESVRLLAGLSGGRLHGQDPIALQIDHPVAVDGIRTQ